MENHDNRSNLWQMLKFTVSANTANFVKFQQPRWWASATLRRHGLQEVINTTANSPEVSNQWPPDCLKTTAQICVANRACNIYPIMVKRLEVTESRSTKTKRVTGCLVFNTNRLLYRGHVHSFGIAGYKRVARWPSGWDAGLAINRSQVRILASPLSSATLGKLLTHMCLSPSSIIWYQPMGGDALRLGR